MWPTRMSVLVVPQLIFLTCGSTNHRWGAPASCSIDKQREPAVYPGIYLMTCTESPPLPAFPAALLSRFSPLPLRGPVCSLQFATLDGASL